MLYIQLKVDLELQKAFIIGAKGFYVPTFKKRGIELLKLCESRDENLSRNKYFFKVGFNPTTKVLLALLL